MARGGALFLLLALLKSLAHAVPVQPQWPDNAAQREGLGRLPNGAAPIPTVTIAEGVELPMAGLGTWQYNSSVAESAVLAALRMGYTHIDTALGYKNQDGVGRALAASGRPRDSYFVTSKIPGGLSYKETKQALHLALEQLFPGQKDAYVDLMLVHFPADWDGNGGKVLRQQEWKALEAFSKAGKASAIGVSHYCQSHLEDLFEIADIKPAVNQVQYHVGMGTAGVNATDFKEYDKQVGVVYESFSPLCGPCDGSDKTELITGKLVTSIGAKYGKTGPQVALKWQVQQGIPVIPKSSNPLHLAQNIDLFSWTLSAEDMATLSAATVPAVSGVPGPDGKPVSGDCDVK